MNHTSTSNKGVTAVPENDSITEWPSAPADNEAQADVAMHRSEDFDKLHGAIVMMVDDEPITLEVTQTYLEDAGYSRFVLTNNPTKTLALLRKERPDILLLDLMMPGMSGFDILREMRTKNILKEIPTIVLTSSHDPRTMLAALELGATDFLSKPVNPSELVLRVRNTLAAKSYRDRLANNDLLTGLPNRKAFLDRLERAMNHAKRCNKSGAVLHIDLNGFKQINDALGPGWGDELLQVVAERVAKVLRNIDLLGRTKIDGPHPSFSRLAGDEFAVLLSVLDEPDSAGQVAQRVLDAIASPILLSDRELRITSGIGIAAFPSDGLDTDTIVRNASVALHHAKREKKNSYKFYSNELNARALNRLNLGNQLRKSIEREELRLYYQPTNDAQTESVCGCEALVRWQHPERGLLEPDEFIQLAEETGLIDLLGHWVIRAACKQSAAWRSAGLLSHRISVNVSGHQFRQTSLPETLRKILADTGVDPSFLIIEITEGVLLENAEANIKVLRDIRAMGIKLSMDDFGTGYSSLSYLNSFPIDELKVDRSFVQEIRQPGDDSPIIRAIIAMAHSLGLAVVAEGVETPLQLQFLQSLGCDKYQGFLVSEPVPPEDFAARFLDVCGDTS